MTTNEIVNKLWNLCNVLRDDGITYHQYVTELTYILFLKMAEETDNEAGIPEQYRWDKLVASDGIDLKKLYNEALFKLGTEGSGIIQNIYKGARSNISEPANLNKIIKNIDALDWFSARQDGLGELYEGLLEKNANEKKSGAGQYFTPRPLINIMVELMQPKIGERCDDPSAGTFGFMIAAHEFLKKKYDLTSLSEEQYRFQRKEAFSGVELVQDTHRLALMNAMLHGLEPDLHLGDTLSGMGENLKNYDLVLANPPFGTKKGGDRPSRTDLTFLTSNKQLNFLQHIYRSLKPNDQARAAVVLPDNVLFEDGDGQRIRRDLMDKCNLHTILRLPTGIFYAAGVKTNVLFFTRGKKDKGNTKKTWIYDMRTNMPSYGKRTPFTRNAFADFVKAYTGGIALEQLATDYDGNINDKKRQAVQDERWSCLTTKEVAAKNYSLDLGLIVDDSLTKSEDLGEPIDIAKEALTELAAITKELNLIIKELG